MHKLYFSPPRSSEKLLSRRWRKGVSTRMIADYLQTQEAYTWNMGLAGTVFSDCVRKKRDGAAELFGIQVCETVVLV